MGVLRDFTHYQFLQKQLVIRSSLCRETDKLPVFLLLVQFQQQKMCIRDRIYADAGGGLSAGDEIYLTGQCSLSFVGQRSLQCNFVNLPKIGSEYLIFAGEHLDVPNEPDLYRLAHVHEFFIAPIFCCEDSPHTIAPTSGPSTNVPYSAVKDNEFFAETGAGFHAWYGLKRQLLAAYP